MAIPTYDQVIESLLRVLSAQSEPVPTSEVRRAFASVLKLSEDEPEQPPPSHGQIRRGTSEAAA